MTTPDIGPPCPNCGLESTGQFCPTCGQRRSIESIPTLWSWFGETLNELFFVEARLPRTLAKLFWPPGELTKEWWEGRRAQYVSPLRVYLLIAIPFFFLVAAKAPGDGPADLNMLSLIAEDLYNQFEPSEEVYEPMEPLPPELANDSTARAEWRREFERRNWRDYALRLERASVVQGGVQRFQELLPVIIALTMIPWLALLLRETERPRRRYVGHLVLSLQLHSVLYAIAGLGWLIAWWVGPIVGYVAGSLYLGMALRRLTGSSGVRTGVLAIIIPLVYATSFIFMYASAIQVLGTWIPGWFFGG